MYRILLRCISSPDLTMHFRTVLELVENGFRLGLKMIDKCFSLSLILI